MKTKLFSFLFTISFSVICFSQTITFDKSITGATQVWQTDDGGYILTDGIYNCTKTNQYGYIEWQKGYQLSSGSSAISKVIKTLDGGYATVGSKLNGTVPDIWFIKLDQNLDTIWTRVYGAPDKLEKGDDLIQLPDSSYIISSYEEDDLSFYLRKTDANGNLIWVKKIIPISILQQSSYLVNLDDDNFLFGKKGTSGKVIKFNSNADTLWIYGYVHTNNSFLTNDGNILISTIYGLEKLDLDGNFIWALLIDNIESFVQSIDDHYLLLYRNLQAPYPSKIIETNTNGYILSEVQIGDNGKYFTNTSDGGFAVCYDWYARFLKTDSDFNYTAVNLMSPMDGEQINTNIFEQYSVIWTSNNVNYINIEYSTDNQNTWNSIIDYYPAEADTFNWVIPALPEGEIFIRISDSFNPEVYDRSDPPQSILNFKSYDYIAANEIFMWMGNNGMNSHDPRNDASGFYWPGGDDATIPAIFADGLVWGGKVNGEIRVNGATYRYGLTSGYILPSGLPSDPTDVKARIFKLKKDWQLLPPGPERSKYEFDFLNWPVDVGAPWDDINDDGVYTLGIDEPKIFGDETLFFVANDLDTAASLFTYGSNPIGLEFQVTTFGFNTELLKDVVFKKYKIVNKSPNTVTDMYFSYWTDDDLGFAGDDYVGCDTLLNLGYSYNGDNYDEDYYGTPPPVVGHLIVQPPIIAAQPTDSARYGDGWKTGFKNIPINSFLLWIGSSPVFIDPQLGDYAGTLEFYNYMQGYSWDGSSIIDPNTSLQTHFVVPGDPVSETGWYEGAGWPGGPNPSDHRFNLTSGPLNMAPGDTQEVAVAILIKKGTDNINSISELKNYAAQIQHWYDNDFITDVKETPTSIPTEFSLSQNYPNPFNPVTTIKYTIPTSPFNPSPYQGEGQRERLVTLRVYDILGSEVATLVNKEQPAGKYEVNFDASRLASGIYFYQLKAGSFVQSKKMVLIK